VREANNMIEVSQRKYLGKYTKEGKSPVLEARKHISFTRVS